MTLRHNGLNVNCIIQSTTVTRSLRPEGKLSDYTMTYRISLTHTAHLEVRLCV